MAADAVQRRDQHVHAADLLELQLHEAHALDAGRAVDVGHAVDRLVQHHGNRGDARDGGVRVPVVHRARLLEQLDARRVQPPREGAALVHVVALVGVQAQRRSAAHQFLHRADLAQVALPLEAHLHLERAKALVQPALDLGRQLRGILAVQRRQHRDREVHLR